MIWDTLHEFPLFIVVEPFGQFQHLGTSDEVRRFMTKDRCIAIQTSQIEEDVLLGKGSFIESSVLHKRTEIGTDCIISQTELFGQMIPNECVIHMLPLSDGTYVTRIWGTTDNPKKSSWFGKPLMNGKTLWESQLFLPQKTKRASVDEALRVRSKFIEEGQMPNQENIKFLSLADGYRYADMREIVSWQQEVLLLYRLTNLIWQNSWCIGALVDV